jgi:hypothetical protein
MDQLNKKEVLVTLIEYIDVLKNAVCSYAEEIRNQNRVVMTEQFTQILEGLQWIFEVINTIKPDIDKNGLNISEKDILNSIRELYEGIQSNDSVIVPDILEYEIIPFLEELKKVTFQLQQLI